MSEKKPKKQRPTKYEKPLKTEASFSELVESAMKGKGYKAPKKSK